MGPILDDGAIADNKILDDVFDNILKRQLDTKHLLQLLQDVEIIKKVLFHERHLVLGPIIMLENEKRAMGMKKYSGPVTKKDKSSQLEVKLSKTGVANREPQWELPEKKIGHKNLGRFNPDAMDQRSICDTGGIMITADPLTTSYENLGALDGMISSTRQGANISGFAMEDAKKMTLQKIDPLRGNHERKFTKLKLSAVTGLEDAGPDSGLGKKVLELEERLNQETALREALEKTVQILQAKVCTLGQQESGKKSEFGLSSQVEDRFKWLGSEVQDLKQGSRPNYKAGSLLEDRPDRDYNRKFYLDLERGKFPKQFHLKSAIHRALQELVEKPAEKKNPIEQRLDDLFMEYLPPKFVSSEGI